MTKKEKIEERSNANEITIEEIDQKLRLYNSYESKTIENIELFYKLNSDTSKGKDESEDQEHIQEN